MEITPTFSNLLDNVASGKLQNELLSIVGNDESINAMLDNNPAYQEIQNEVNKDDTLYKKYVNAKNNLIASPN
jgi:hypothetical protein